MPDDALDIQKDADDTPSIVERAMRRAGVGQKAKESFDDARVVVGSEPAAPASVPGSSASVAPLSKATSVEAPHAAVPGAGDPTRDSASAGPKPRAPAVERAGSQPVLRYIDEKASEQDEVAGQRSKTVELDFDRLRANGFITPENERSRMTEEFRLIKRGLLNGIYAARSEARRNPNLVMVTSAKPGEGKTFNSVNLAISIASEPDLNVLLIDADLTNPSVFGLLGVETGRGLVDVIEGTVSDLSSVLVRTNIERLSLLGAGTPHPMATELLASERMKKFVDDIAHRYSDRIIIFDAAPVLATSEPTVLAEHMSHVVFVVEAEQTSSVEVQDALDLLGEGPRIGIVLNKARPQFGVRQFGAYYKAYRSSE